MTISLTTVNLNKRKTFFIFDYPLMHLQQNVIQFGKYICYNLTDLHEDPDEKKMVLQMRAREKYFQKYTG